MVSEVQAQAAISVESACDTSACFVLVHRKRGHLIISSSLKPQQTQVYTDEFLLSLLSLSCRATQIEAYILLPNLTLATGGCTTFCSFSSRDKHIEAHSHYYHTSLSSTASVHRSIPSFSAFFLSVETYR